MNDKTRAEILDLLASAEADLHLHKKLCESGQYATADTYAQAATLKLAKAKTLIELA